MKNKLQQYIKNIKTFFISTLAGSLGKTEKITNENWWKNNFFIDWIKSILKKREYMSDDENRNIKNKSEDDFEKNISFIAIMEENLKNLKEGLECQQ